MLSRLRTALYTEYRDQNECLSSGVFYVSSALSIQVMLMSEDVSFRIQLGLILPKIKEKVGSDLCAIVQELADILQSGNVEGESDIETDLAAIKEIFLKDMEIYLDKEVMPVISQSLQSASDANPEAEDGVQDSEASEAEEVAAD